MDSRWLCPVRADISRILAFCDRMLSHTINSGSFFRGVAISLLAVALVNFGGPRKPLVHASAAVDVVSLTGDVVSVV